jgi:N-acetylneuraminic acid mutarotase
MIKNTGNREVFIDSVRVSDCFYSTFTGSLQPGDSINVSFMFRPEEQKHYAGLVQVFHSFPNDTEIKPLGFVLSGEGSASFAVGEWVERKPFPGTARYEAAFFSIGGNGFVCLGTTYNGNISDEVWEYGAADQWKQKSNFPGGLRKSPVGFSINGKGYMGLGFQRTDFWEYDYSTDTWARKADFPGQARIKAVCVSTSGKGYVGLGYDGTKLFHDFWEYDPVADKWTQLPDYPGRGTVSAAAFTLNDRIYTGTGRDGELDAGHTYSDFWEYDPATGRWVGKADFAGGVTSSAVSFSIGNYGYMGGGTGKDGTATDNSFWEYDPLKDAWAKKAYMLNYSDGGVFYGTGSRGYFGIGFMTSPYFWEFNPDK